MGIVISRETSALYQLLSERSTEQGGWNPYVMHAMERLLTVEDIQPMLDTIKALVPPFTVMQFRSDLIRTAIHHAAQWLRANVNEATAAAPPKPASDERTALRDSYLADFTGERIKIIDMCWAAGQHKREWKRWLKGELKDGGTADLAFRRLLTSGKKPKKFRRQLRTPGWE